jgi:ferredoxin
VVHHYSLPFSIRRSQYVDCRARCFSRSSITDNKTIEAQAKTFVITVGYTNEPDIAQGVVDALKESGLSGEMLLSTLRSMAGRWEVGEDEGLEALVASVKQSQSRLQGKATIQIWCVPPTAWASGASSGEQDTAEQDSSSSRKAMMKRAFSVQTIEGTSLTDVAKFGQGAGADMLGEYLECACAGIMACSTCHVVIDEMWFEKVGDACEAEQDMIDLAYSPRPTSRLGCQVVLTKELDGMVIRLPKGANNLMDFIPFED